VNELLDNVSVPASHPQVLVPLWDAETLGLQEPPDAGIVVEYVKLLMVGLFQESVYVFALCVQVALFVFDLPFALTVTVALLDVLVVLYLPLASTVILPFEVLIENPLPDVIE